MTNILQEKQENLDEYWRVMRKLSGPRTMLVMDALLDGKKLTRKELRKTTGITDQQLNHELTDLCDLKLLIRHKDEKTYQMTVYGQLFMYLIDDLMVKLALNKDKLFKPDDPRGHYSHGGENDRHSRGQDDPHPQDPVTPVGRIPVACLDSITCS